LDLSTFNFLVEASSNNDEIIKPLDKKEDHKYSYFFKEYFKSHENNQITNNIFFPKSETIIIIAENNEKLPL